MLPKLVKNEILVISLKTFKYNIYYIISATYK